LNTSKAEIADFEIAILINENVTGFEITVNDASGMDVFQPSLHKVSELRRLYGRGKTILVFDRGSTG
jgi:hypothetical protein